MIVEVGTSDFRTLAGKVDGLFVEPVKEYYDRLPKCRKEQVAVSNYEGEIAIYYVPSKVIEEKNLPAWYRGCNSVGKIHPTVAAAGHGALCVKDTVSVVRIKSLLEKHNITHIDLLKIDTEGHDAIILNDFLDTVKFLPKVIQFENNSLSEKKEVTPLVVRLQKLGYNCSQVRTDMVCKR